MIGKDTDVRLTRRFHVQFEFDGECQSIIVCLETDDGATVALELSAEFIRANGVLFHPNDERRDDANTPASTMAEAVH